MVRPAKDPQIRINEILDVAEPLFYSNGYHETTITDIVKKMGVAQGFIYYYFKSKEEILEALLKRVLVTFMSEIDSMVYDPSVSPLDKLNLVLQTIFHNMQIRDRLLFALLSDDRTLNIRDKFFFQGKQFLAPLLKKIIEEGTQQNFFHPSHPQVTAHIILPLFRSILDAGFELPDNLVACQIQLVEELIAKALGVPADTIQINLLERI